MTEPIGWYVVQPPTDGLLSGEIKEPTASLAGAAPFYGPFQVATKAFTAQMNGHQPTTGPLAATLKKLTASLTKEYLTATLASIAKKATAALVGTTPPTGTLAATSKAPVTSLLGEQTYTTAMIVALKKLEQANFQGLQTQTGTASFEAKKTVATLAGTQAQSGTAAMGAKKATAAVQGEIPEPVFVNWTTPGTYEWVVPSGITKIDRIVLGGGKAGRIYGFGVSANGGWAGDFAWDTLTVGVDVNVGDTLTIVVGSGGASNGAFGTDSTITAGANTITGLGAAESGFRSGYTGEPVNTGNTNSNKDLLYNGQTYVGGAGGTGSSSNDPAGPPVFPGGGGWGSNSNGINGRPGGHGRVWIYGY